MKTASTTCPPPKGAICANCPFAVNGHPPHAPVWGVGPKDALGVIVAESPGTEEVEKGRPLVGPTGRQFDDELLKAGLQRAKLFIVNAILCRPLRGKTEGDMKKAVDACNGALFNQLVWFKRTIPVLAMGRWAHYAVRGVEKGVGNERGFVRRDFELPRSEE